MSSEVKSIIEKTLERAGDELAGVRLKNISPDQNFFGGEGAVLDSLNLVSFIFILEDEIRAMTGKTVKVSTNDILSKAEAPFKNLRSMESWLAKKIAETK